MACGNFSGPGRVRTLMTTLMTGHETPYARVREISGSVET